MSEVFNFCSNNQGYGGIIEPGDIEIGYVNDDTIRHTLVVVEGDTKVGTLELQVNKRGDVDTGTINLPAGSYSVFCTVPGHQNMKADLTVK